MNTLKSKLDKFDVDKLKPVPFNLKRLSNIFNKEAVKKDVHNELVKEVNASIPYTSKLDNKNYNAKIKDIEDKIPSITRVATPAVFNAVLNKVPSVSELVK